MSTRVDSSPGGDQRNSDLGSALSDVRTEADHGKKWFSKVAEGLLPIRHRVSLRAVWRELCSLPVRIAILRKNNWFRYGICLESVSQRANLPHEIRDKYRRARIRGIQKLLSIHPGACPLDFHILLRTIDRDLFEEDQDKAEE